MHRLGYRPTAENYEPFRFRDTAPEDFRPRTASGRPRPAVGEPQEDWPLADAADEVWQEGGPAARRYRGKEMTPWFERFDGVTEHDAEYGPKVAEKTARHDVLPFPVRDAARQGERPTRRGFSRAQLHASPPSYDRRAAPHQATRGPSEPSCSGAARSMPRAHSPV